jgi:hypothetical protein
VYALLLSAVGSIQKQNRAGHLSHGIVLHPEIIVQVQHTKRFLSMVNHHQLIMVRFGGSWAPLRYQHLLMDGFAMQAIGRRSSADTSSQRGATFEGSGGIMQGNLAIDSRERSWTGEEFSEPMFTERNSAVNRKCAHVEVDPMVKNQCIF